MTPENLLTEAYLFAFVCHFRDKRKVDGQPYFEHPVRVAEILARSRADHRICAAGLLHDVLETNQRITVADLATHFGEYIATMVSDVTEKDSKLSWRVRKEAIIADIPRMRRGSVMIKAADKIDHLDDLFKNVSIFGASFMNRFNAQLPAQIEISTRLVDAIEIRFPRHPLVSGLHRALDNICNLSVDGAGFEPATSSM